MIFICYKVHAIRMKMIHNTTYLACPHQKLCETPQNESSDPKYCIDSGLSEIRNLWRAAARFKSSSLSTCGYLQRPQRCVDAWAMGWRLICAPRALSRKNSICAPPRRNSISVFAQSRSPIQIWARTSPSNKSYSTAPPRIRSIEQPTLTPNTPN